jgi:cytochrome c oxidase assembly protein subunit 15
MNGMWFPKGMWRLQGFSNLTDNPVTVQFIHRSIAYLFLTLVIIWWIRSGKARSNRLFQASRHLPVLLTILQVIIGIFTVIYSPDRISLLWLGVSHQFLAMVLILLLVWLMYVLRVGPQPVQKPS